MKQKKQRVIDNFEFYFNTNLMWRLKHKVNIEKKKNMTQMLSININTYKYSTKPTGLKNKKKILISQLF